ncbi:glycosyltransferase family 4 protein [Vibrio tetraodonis]|uniref:glycosyltransferase family 4 protein n=1 Tax=Vibrio tetraodonis TaxID=2231647 RepID=UPI0030B80FD5
MSKSSILHICLSQGWGGLEMYPIRIGSEFLKRGYRVYGLCIKGTRVAKGMQESGIETFEINSKKSLFSNQFLLLSRWLKERDVRIIHSHKSGDVLISALLDLLSKRYSFFTEHMGVTKPKKDIFHQWVYSHLYRVFSISNETYRRNLKALPVEANKINQLWLGTDVPLQSLLSTFDISEIKNELNIPEDSVVIGNVGRICAGKGQAELLEAFSKISTLFSNSHLLLVGGMNVSEGSENDFVASIKKRIKELNLNNRVHLAGFRTDAVRMLSVMDIVCLPNHNEAFGLTAIEAMAAKKAIVGANTGSLPEVLGNAALLCDPFDPNNISQKIEQYLTSSELIQTKSTLAYQRALELFSMDKHITNLETHYTEAYELTKFQSKQ